jgi:hypothetical protein
LWKKFCLLHYIDNNDQLLKELNRKDVPDEDLPKLIVIVFGRLASDGDDARFEPRVVDLFAASAFDLLSNSSSDGSAAF